MQLCRACLSTDKNMIPLDEIFINNYNLLTNLNITLLDKMPQYCCQSCWNAVKAYIEFRDKCISSETTLRDIIFAKVKPDSKVEEFECRLVSEVTEIKQEIKEEPGDESTLNSCLNDDYGDYEDVQYLIESEDLKPKRTCRKRKKTEKESEVESTLANDLKPKRSYKKKKKNVEPDMELPIVATQKSDDKIPCGLCPKTFDSKETLTKHLSSHNPHKGCGLCSEQVDGMSQMFAHRLAHIPVKQMCCHICFKKYRKSLYLEYHYKCIHFKEKNIALKCKMCPSTFESPRKLMKHYWAIHSVIRYFCDYCSKGFRNKAPLKVHIKCHLADKLYFCDLCEFSCKYSGGLKDHKVRRHAVNKTYCGFCGRAFKNQEEKDKHKCGNKPVVCPICGVQVKQQARLSQHMIRHTNIQTYACDRCPAKYKSRGALVAHLNRHDGNRQFKCEYCDAMFYTQSVLIKHRRTHTGEKPYVCKVCGKAFTGNNNLKVHMKVHGEYLIVKKNKELENKTNVVGVFF